jgi:hypothetical protein
MRYKEVLLMIYLAGIALLICMAYLVFAIVDPERF